MSKFLNYIMRVAAYGAIPAFLYLGMVVATGGGEPEMILPALYIGVISGVLIAGWVERRKTARNK